jgi:mRNA interferase MazF
VLVVQSDAFNQSRIPTVVVVPLSSNLRLAEAPGNVPIKARLSGLVGDTIANVAQLITLERRSLRPTPGRVPPATLAAIEEGLRLVLAL